MNFDNVKSQAANFMLSLGQSAVTRSMYPFWQNEPKIPQSMLDELSEIEYHE